jgi:hypothetical protein
MNQLILLLKVQQERYGLNVADLQINQLIHQQRVQPGNNQSNTHIISSYHMFHFINYYQSIIYCFNLLYTSFTISNTQICFTYIIYYRRRRRWRRIRRRRRPTNEPTNSPTESPTRKIWIKRRRPTCSPTNSPTESPTRYIIYIFCKAFTLYFFTPSLFIPMLFPFHYI